MELLNSIHKFFNVGAVSLSGKGLARYRVRSLKDLEIIIKHFKDYPLQTSKAISFTYFCEILNLMNSNAHTNVNGFLKLVSLINLLNKPIVSSTLDKINYLGILPDVEIEAPVVNQNVKLNPNWI